MYREARDGSAAQKSAEQAKNLAILNTTSGTTTELESAFVHDLVAQSSDGLLVVDGSGIVVFSNPAADALFGSSPKSLLGTQFGFPHAPEEGWTNLELPRDGKPTFVEMRISPIVWHGADATLATLRNVTEQREIESIVAMQLKAMETVANGIFVTDIKNRFKWVNEAFCLMCGHAESDLIGQTVDLVNSNAHDADFLLVFAIQSLPVKYGVDRQSIGIGMDICIRPIKP